ncbi:MAG: S8 family serine peptidase, partial [Achromobacter sp.]|nr:S8 family serine peptidase [Achromobacter sp.]
MLPMRNFKESTSMMTKRILALSVSLALSSSVMASELRRVEGAIEGKYIVVLKEDSLRPGAQGMRKAVENAAVDLSARFDLNVERVYGHALPGFAVGASEKDIARLLHDPRVEYVEEDGMMYPIATQSGATWGLDRVDQRDRPLNGTYIYTPTASNVRAYVIDSGILASHADFGGRVLAGATAISDGRGASDCNGHGTHVAGTIGGATWGVAKAIRLVPVRVFGCTGGSANSTIISGIDWVRANAVKPAVANSAFNTFRANADNPAAIQQKWTHSLSQMDMLIQPYVPQIAAGEWSLMFFRTVLGGIRFSHAVLKIPATGDMRVQ